MVGPVFSGRGVGLSGRGFGLGRARRALLGGVAGPGDNATRLIYDDDNDSDPDGLTGWAYVVGMLRRQGPAKFILAAIIATSPVSTTAPALRAMADFAGYSHVPVGAYQGTAIGGSMVSTFTPAMVTAFAQPGQADRSAFPAAVAVYRQALAASPNGSVVIYIGGTATNIAAVMASPGDAIDPRSGADLLAAKVKFVVMCAGNFVSQQINEANLWNDLAAGQALVSQTYMDVIFAGLEHGGNISLRIDGTLADPRDPVQYGWDWANSTQRGGGDQVAASIAFTGGVEGDFGLSPYGTCMVASNTVTTFTPGPGRFRYVTLATDYTTAQTNMQAVINEYSQWANSQLGPYLTSFPIIKRTPGAVGSYTITSSESFTASLVSGAGYSLAGNVVTLPSYGSTGARSFTVRLTGADGKASDWVIADDIVAADIANFLLAEWKFDEASGETLLNATGDTRFNGYLGNSAGNTTQNPTRVAQGLDFSGSGQVAMVPYVQDFQFQSPMDLQSFVASAVFKTDTLTGLHTLIAKHQAPIGDSAWQFRQNGTEFDFVGRGATTTVPVSTGAALALDVYYLASVRVNGTAVEFYKNGVLLSSHKLSNVVPNDKESAMTFGARGPTLTEVLDGILSYGSFAYDCGPALMPALYQRAKTAMAAKGITI